MVCTRPLWCWKLKAFFSLKMCPKRLQSGKCHNSTVSCLFLKDTRNNFFVYHCPLFCFTFSITDRSWFVLTKMQQFLLLFFINRSTMQNRVTRISKNIQKHKFSDAYDVGIFLINLVKMAFWYSVLKFQFILHL